MSALGQSRHTCPLSPKADIRSALAQVRFGPKADIRFFEDRSGIAYFIAGRNLILQIPASAITPRRSALNRSARQRRTIVVDLEKRWQVQ